MDFGFAPGSGRAAGSYCPPDHTRLGPGRRRAQTSRSRAGILQNKRVRPAHVPAPVPSSETDPGQPGNGDTS